MGAAHVTLCSHASHHPESIILISHFHQVSLPFPPAFHRFPFLFLFIPFSNFLPCFSQEEIGMRGLWQAVSSGFFWGHPGPRPHRAEWAVWPPGLVGCFQCLLALVWGRGGGAVANTDHNPGSSIWPSLSGRDLGLTAWPSSLAFQFSVCVCVCVCVCVKDRERERCSLFFF